MRQSGLHFLPGMLRPKGGCPPGPAPCALGLGHIRHHTIGESMFSNIRGPQGWITTCAPAQRIPQTRELFLWGCRRCGSPQASLLDHSYRYFDGIIQIWKQPYAIYVGPLLDIWVHACPGKQVNTNISASRGSFAVRCADGAIWFKLLRLSRSARSTRPLPETLTMLQPSV
jgi:hypothetical protein